MPSSVPPASTMPAYSAPYDGRLSAALCNGLLAGRRGLHLVLSLPLGLVQRAVGSRHERVGAAVARIRGRPEARGYRDDVTARSRYAELFDRLANTLGQPACPGKLRTRQDEGDLLAAEACREIELPDGLREDRRDGAQDGVTRLVPVTIVDLLEVVDVGEHERQVRAEPPRVVELVVDALIEQAPVREAGKSVGMRLPSQPSGVGEYTRDRTREPGRETGGQRERQRSCKQQTPAIRDDARFDRGDWLDRDDASTVDRNAARDERCLAESDAAARNVGARADGASRYHPPVLDEQQCSVVGQWCCALQQRDEGAVERHAHGDMGKRVFSIRDRRAGGDQRLSRQRVEAMPSHGDSRVPCPRNPCELGAIAGDERPLKRERRRKLAGSRAQIGSQRSERRRGDARRPRELRLRLLHVRLVRGAVEREDNGRGHAAGEREHDQGSADDCSTAVARTDAVLLAHQWPSFPLPWAPACPLPF